MGQNAVNPLSWNVPIVNKDGTPTDEFMRKWLQQATTNATIPILSTPAQVSAVIDVIDATPGDMLIRGTTLWEGVDPFTLFDAAGAAAAAQTAAELFATNADAVVLAAAETFSANASNLTAGTVAVARLPVATTAALGVVKPDGSTITIAGGVISAAGGGGGSGAAYLGGRSMGGTISSSAFATKGNFWKPLVDITVLDVFCGITATAGHVIRMSVLSLASFNTVSSVISSVLATATATVVTSGAVLKFVLSSALVLPAGGNYAIVFTDTNAASGTTAIGLPQLASLSSNLGIPCDPSLSSSSSGDTMYFANIASLNPVAGNTLNLSNSVGYALLIKATL